MKVKKVHQSINFINSGNVALAQKKQTHRKTDGDEMPTIGDETPTIWGETYSEWAKCPGGETFQGKTSRGRNVQGM